MEPVLLRKTMFILCTSTEISNEMFTGLYVKQPLPASQQADGLFK